MAPRESRQSRSAQSSSRFSNAARQPGWVLLFAFALLVLVLLGRILFLQTFMHDEYSDAAADQRTSSITLSARRGTIYDRNGIVLATTVDATTVYANPAEVTDPEGEAASIASVLGGTADDYIDALSQSDLSFAYVYRKADVDVASSLEELDLDGIYFLEDSKRVYPYDGVGSQIVGVTDTDGNGISGLELQYDDVLKGTDGTLVEQRGLNGTPISGGVEVSEDAVDGQDIALTVDIELQQYVEQTLSSYVSSYEADGGSITVYDGATGEIYASVSTPQLDTGSSWRESDGNAFVLNTVSDAYEPGSTMKSVTAAALVDQNAVTPETSFDIPASLSVDTNTITDSHEHGELTYTTAQILQQSSNIGIVLASRLIPRDTLYDYYVKFGFGQDCGVDFPGASNGVLSSYTTWSETQAANVPFGQGVSVSALQLVRAYGVFTNNGVMNTPHFLLSSRSSDVDTNWETTQVVSSATAQTMTQMLISVVDEGTGSPAAMTHYTVAGKTGTAEKVNPETGLYYADQYNISFCGYLPNSGSQLICLVVMDNPRTTGTMGYVFADVMGEVADIYGLVYDR